MKRTSIYLRVACCLLLSLIIPQWLPSQVKHGFGGEPCPANGPANPTDDCDGDGAVDDKVVYQKTIQGKTLRLCCTNKNGVGMYQVYFIIPNFPIKLIGQCIYEGGRNRGYYVLNPDGSFAEVVWVNAEGVRANGAVIDNDDIGNENKDTYRFDTGTKKIRITHSRRPLLDGCPRWGGEFTHVNTTAPFDPPTPPDKFDAFILAEFGIPQRNNSLTGNQPDWSYLHFSGAITGSGSISIEINNHVVTTPTLGIASLEILIDSLVADLNRDWVYGSSVLTEQGISASAEPGGYLRITNVGSDQVNYSVDLEPNVFVDRNGICNAVAISNPQPGFDFALHPNPPIGRECAITLPSILSQEESEITVYDAIGNLILQCPSVYGQMTYPLRFSAAGLYFVSIRNATGQKTKRIIVL
jgi:hypothetical protein